MTGAKVRVQMVSQAVTSMLSLSMNGQIHYQARLTTAPRLVASVLTTALRLVAGACVAGLSVQQRYEEMETNGND